MNLIHYLIICPLVFLAGYIDAIAGGGGLISLPAYMLTGLPVHNCIASNKLSSFMGTSLTTARYARNGYIRWRLALFCIPCAFAGSALGANLALLVPEDIFLRILLVILPLTGAYVLFRKELSGRVSKKAGAGTCVICMLAALVIGVYDGFYGPGTGTFLILLLTGLASLEIREANGLTKAINFTTNLSALIVFARNGQVLLPLALIAGLFNIAGNYFGSKRFDKGGSRAARPVIILVLCIFFVKVLLQILGIA